MRRITSSLVLVAFALTGIMRPIVRAIVPAIISIVLLVPSSVVALSKDRPQEHQRWATATLSTIITLLAYVTSPRRRRR